MDDAVQTDSGVGAVGMGAAQTVEPPTVGEQQAQRPDDMGVTAKWETDWLELPDHDLAHVSLVLLPTYYFGGAFQVTAVERLPSIDPCAEVPPRVRVSAMVSRRLYTVMMRFQQGAESFGDDPAPWALVEGSATDVATGRVLGVGEVFPPG